MALLKTAANSIPNTASATAKMTKPRFAMPGTANHKSRQPAMPSTENTAIHGLRGPDASAIAPSTGEERAISRPPMPVA